MTDYRELLKKVIADVQSGSDAWDSLTREEVTTVQELGKEARGEPTDNGEAEHPCFSPGEPSSIATCNGDGWFRCGECSDLCPETRADLEE